MLLSSAQFHTPSTVVSKDFFGYCEVIASVQLPFALSVLFCYQDAREKGSDLIYEEMHFMTFAPGTMAFQIRRAIKCVQGSFLKKRRGQFCTDFTICIKSDHTSVSMFLL